MRVLLDRLTREAAQQARVPEEHLADRVVGEVVDHDDGTGATLGQDHMDDRLTPGDVRPIDEHQIGAADGVTQVRQTAVRKEGAQPAARQAQGGVAQLGDRLLGGRELPPRLLEPAPIVLDGDQPGAVNRSPAREQRRGGATSKLDDEAGRQQVREGLEKGQGVRLQRVRILAAACRVLRGQMLRLVHQLSQIVGRLKGQRRTGPSQVGPILVKPDLLGGGHGQRLLRRHIT